MNIFTKLFYVVKARRLLFFTVLSISFSGNILSTELVYQPVNPSFGGSPLNAGALLNSAQAQNKHQDPSRRSSERPSELDRLTASLQSRLLSQLLADVGNGNTGSFSTDQFNLSIVDDGLGGLSISITDTVTGETTNISVNGLIPD